MSEPPGFCPTTMGGAECTAAKKFPRSLAVRELHAFTEPHGKITGVSHRRRRTPRKRVSACRPRCLAFPVIPSRTVGRAWP